MKKDIIRGGILIGTSIAITAYSIGVRKGWIGFTPTPDNNPNPTEPIKPPENQSTISELPVVEPVYENEVKAFFEGSNCGNAWSEVGVTIPDISGTFWGGNNLLFTAMGETGAQRYCLLQSGGKETQLQHGQIEGTTQIVFFAEPTGTPNEFGQLAIQETYFIWDLSSDELGNTIVTFQSDGTPNTEQKFIFPGTPNFGPMGEGLTTISYNPETNQLTVTPEPAPALSPEMEKLQKNLDGTPYALGWNEDQTALVLTYSDPETNEKTEIEEIAFDKTGKMTVTQSEEKVESDPTTIETDSQTLIFKDKDSRIWVIDSGTLIDREVLDIFAEHDFDRLYKSLHFEVENGVVKAYDKETEKLIFENGKFDLRFVVENLRPETLEKTNIEPINGDHRGAPREADFYNSDTFRTNRNFLENLIAPNEGDKILTTSLLLYEFPDNNSYAWGFTLNLKKPGESMSTGHYLIFRDINGELVTYPIQDISPVDVGSFYDN